MIGRILAGEAVSDTEFDKVFPDWVRALSSVHWTPVEIARFAAELLVTDQDTRVLDIGSGVGKFCLVGAASRHSGRFVGVEQRPHLVEVAQAAAVELGVDRATFVAANILEVALGDFDSFYFFNAFAENAWAYAHIDDTVPRQHRNLREYTTYLQDQFNTLPAGTRIVTYHGGLVVPDSYRRAGRYCQNCLDLWIKRRSPQPMRSPKS